MHFDRALYARLSGGQCFKSASTVRVQVCAGRPLRLFEYRGGLLMRHEGYGNDPFPDQHVLYDQTSEAVWNGWSRTEMDKSNLKTFLFSGASNSGNSGP